MTATEYGREFGDFGEFGDYSAEFAGAETVEEEPLAFTAGGSLDNAEHDTTLSGDEDDAAPCLSSRISAADVLTLGNAACGFLAIYFLACATLAQHTDGGGSVLERKSAAAAVVLMLIGALCDLCDGLVARKLRQSALGAELDNLADVITFGVAPAFFVVTWAAVPLGPGKAPAVLVAMSVLIAGVLRLARFATTPGRPGVFQGMPIPMGAMTVVSIVVLNLPVAVALPLIVAVSWAMVSRVEYPKPSGHLAIVTMLGIASSVSCLTAWAMDAPGSDWLLHTGASLQIVLALFLPAVAVTRRGARFVGARMIR